MLSRNIRTHRLLVPSSWLARRFGLRRLRGDRRAIGTGFFATAVRGATDAFLPLTAAHFAGFAQSSSLAFRSLRSARPRSLRRVLWSVHSCPSLSSPLRSSLGHFVSRGSCLRPSWWLAQSLSSRLCAPTFGGRGFLCGFFCGARLAVTWARGRAVFARGEFLRPGFFLDLLGLIAHLRSFAQPLRARKP